jgi:hypothetical protein
MSLPGSQRGVTTNRNCFDSIMLPVNCATWHAGNFGPQVLTRAQQKKMGILALKAMAKRPWTRGAGHSAHPNCWYEPFTDPEEALSALRFTLSHPVTTALMPASATCLKLGLSLASKFSPLNAEEVEAMKQKGLATAPLFRYRSHGCTAVEPRGERNRGHRPRPQPSRLRANLVYVIGDLKLSH